MNRTEHLLRDTLQDYASLAPEFTAMRPESRTRRRWEVVAPMVGVALAVGVVGVVAWFDGGMTTPQDISPASAYQEVADLTGEDVGIALGLEPQTNESRQGCDFAANYRDNIGFCLDGVTDDMLERVVLASQIDGYQRNDALIEDARLSLQGGAILDSDMSEQEMQEALERIHELRAALKPQLIKATGNSSAEKVSVSAADVEGLSALEVADRLGLWRNTDSIVSGCHRGVGTGGEGLYCLDSIATDEWTMEHIAAQLQGYEDNEAMHAYVDAVAAWQEIRRTGTTAESTDMWRTAMELREHMTKA